MKTLQIYDEDGNVKEFRRLFDHDLSPMARKGAVKGQWGQKPKLDEDDMDDLRIIARKYQANGWSAASLAKLFDIAEPTLYAYLRDLGISLAPEAVARAFRVTE